jgi:hypothetical protein
MRTRYIVPFLCILALSGIAATAKPTSHPNLLQYIDSSAMKKTVAFSQDEIEHCLSYPDIIKMWGWAKNGRVAYSLEGKDDTAAGAGYFCVDFIIFDFIEDINLFEFTMNSIDQSAGQWKTRGKIAVDLYAIYADEINGALSKYGIIEQQAEFLPLPIKQNNAVYTADAVMTSQSAQPGYGNPEIEYKIVVKKNNASSNTITTVQTSASAIAVCGYFLSPFENRVLVVIAEADGGAMCFFPAKMRFRFSGCHLDMGF